MKTNCSPKYRQMIVIYNQISHRYRFSSVSMYFRMLFPISLQTLRANTIWSIAYNKYMRRSRITNCNVYWNIRCIPISFLSMFSTSFAIPLEAQDNASSVTHGWFRYVPLSLFFPLSPMERGERIGINRGLPTMRIQLCLQTIVITLYLINTHQVLGKIMHRTYIYCEIY